MDNYYTDNLPDMAVTTKSGKDVKETMILTGEASDSLHGKNEVKEYKTKDCPKGPGKTGGMNSFSV
ncbi:MAG: hypothetical protein K1X66_02360 [Verrucomicrobiae bacterium]|nr:hypothetical protein [Verrucomicrobiae bacterium]